MEEWQKVNDTLMIGEKSAYSKQDKRVLLASDGDWDMDESWPFYFEDRVKYERIGKQQYLTDPKRNFYSESVLRYSH